MTSPDSSPRILLVDDELSIRELFGDLLRLDGYTVGLASNGLDALDAFKSAPWDLILTDWKMPEMDGEQLSERIKELSPRTPIVMMTGFPPPTGCQSVDAILTKPFSRDTINDVIS